MFVLDVEGAEADILKTIPFDKVQINFFYIEHNYNNQLKMKIREVMEKSGYEHVREFHYNSIYRKTVSN